MLDDRTTHFSYIAMSFVAGAAFVYFLKVIEPLRKPPLRISDKSKTVVLDLDETLIHSSTSAPIFGWFGRVKCVQKTLIFGNQFVRMFIYVRPNLESFLDRVALKYNIIVITAAEKQYAEPIIDMIDQKKRISQKFYRSSCRALGNNVYLKDLSLIGANLKSTVLVDNCETGVRLNPANSIRIKSWTGSPWDSELNKVASILEQIESFEDIREPLVSFVQNAGLGKDE